jgi:hypothetical protein
MAQNLDISSENFPRTYIVNPPVSAMRVPVVYNPAYGNEVIAYLKSGTMVTVLSRSELWLHIQLPGSYRGYIQFTYARPATEQEQQAVMARSVPGTAEKSDASLLSTTAGISSGWQAGPHLQTAYNWFKFAAGCFSLGLLSGFVAVNSCHAGDTQCAASQGPLVTIAFVLFFASLVFFIISIITGIVILVQNRTIR